MGRLDLGAKLVRSIEKIAKEQKAAEKAGDVETALEKNKQLRSAIQAGVNDPAMPRAKPLSDQELAAYAERMAPQIEGKLTRGKTGAKTVAGKTQKQFEREKTLPVQRRVLPGQEDPSKPLPTMTMEDQKGGVLVGLSGDPTLSRTELSGIDDVLFEKPVTLEGGPRYKNKNKFWASNIAGATNLIGAGRRASEQYGGAPVYAMYQKMPEGFGFAQHYLDSLLQYIRPDQLPKAAREALEDDIRKGFINAQGKRVTFPKFSGFDDLNEVSLATEANSILRGHIADRLEKSKLYGLRPAGDVQFAVTHPELTNLETGASGFTIAELPLDQQFTPSPHRTYTEDIEGTVLGQTRHPTPYDLIYRDELDLVRLNPKIADEPFNTLKLLGPRQKIDEQLVNELNEYQERLRRLLGYKEGGEVEMAGGGAISKLAKLLSELPAGSKAAQEAVAAEMAAREEELRALYAPHTLSTEKGNKALSDIKQMLEPQNPPIKKADGGSVDAQQPDWYNQLGSMMQSSEPTWYDQLGEMMMAEGGAVKMADGGNPMGDIAFSDTANVDDRSQYQRVLDLLAQKAKEQGREELLSLKDPGAITDLINKGLIAENLGGVVDLFSLPLDAVDALLNKALKTDRRYLSSEQPFGGSESMKRGMENIGVATKTERPLAELTTGIVGPGVVAKAAKTAPKVVAGAKKAGEALAPTVADLLETQLQKSGMMVPMAPEGKAGKVKAPANPVGFYNPAEKAALNLQRKKGSGDTFIADLKKQPGVNDERITELGLDQFRGRPDVTKEEIIAASQERRIPLQESVKRERDESAIEALEQRHDELLDLHSEATVTGDARAREQYAREMADNLAQQKRLKSEEEARFGPSSSPEYSTPGGTDYREIRVKLPSSRPSIKNMSRAEYNAAIEKADREGIQDFTHSIHHGDEPNVLFHLRVANHADEEGKKGLLIDELQSDWHQEGSKKGYKGGIEKEYNRYFESLRDRFIVEQKQQNIKAGMTPTDAEYYATEMYSGLAQREGYPGIARALGEEDKMIELSNQYKRDIYSVPNAPFKDNWYQLGLKRAIKEAVDNGMDRVYLTTGARQADRYDLSKQISFLGIEPKPNGMVRINASKDGEPVILKDVPKDQLADYVGKEMAKKAISDIDAGNPAVYSDLDLKVGGEGMKQWYDKTYKNYLEKYAKQHGSKLGMTELKGTREEWPFPITIKEEGGSYRLFGTDPRTGSFNNNLAGKEFNSWEEAEKARDRFYEGTVEPVYYIDITPQMKESAKKGQSYRKGGTVKDFKLQQELKRYAVGGEIYNTSPDRSDGGLMIIERNGYA